MKSATPFDKAQVIEGSLRCFAWGLVGVLPGIGLPFAIIAIGHYFRIARHKGDTWNPAAAYLEAGGICAVLGVLITMLLAGVIFVEAS